MAASSRVDPSRDRLLEQIDVCIAEERELVIAYHGLPALRERLMRDVAANVPVEIIDARAFGSRLHPL